MSGRAGGSRSARSGIGFARGCLLAGSSAGLAITAHSAADGTVPHLPTAILLTALIGWVSTATADRTKGLPGILLVLGTGQLLMHLSLGGASGHFVGGFGMTAGHALATVATALLLSHAESLLLIAVAALRKLSPVVWLPVPVGTPVTLPGLGRTGVRGQFIAVMLRRVCRRRGPPLPS
ncbi:hypothetical protein ABZ639_14830 [Saccharomonospora sp. NPDC006951]